MSGEENLNRFFFENIKCDKYFSENESVTSIELNEHAHKNIEDSLKINNLSSAIERAASILGRDVEDSDSDAEIVISNRKNNYRSEAPSGMILENGITFPNTSQEKPTIGNVTIQNSAHPMFGNKTFYKGKITINNFVNDKDEWKKNETHTDDDIKFATNELNHHNQQENNSSPEIQSEKPKSNCKAINKRTISLAIAIFGVLLLILLILILAYNHNNESDVREPLRIISRGEWNARPSKNLSSFLELPSIRVIIAHTVTDPCSVKASCKKLVRTIQDIHMNQFDWDDIGYHWLVGGDGAVYEARGWEIEGAHTLGYNKRSICVAFIGEFGEEVPPKRQLDAAQNIIEEGVNLKKIRADYDLYGQRQLISTESPGKALFDIIKNWEHWNEVVEENILPRANYN